MTAVLAAIKEAKDRVFGNPARIPKYRDDMTPAEKWAGAALEYRYNPALRRRIREAHRWCFLRDHAPALVPVLTRSGRRELVGRAKGQLLDWHWTLPRRHRWLGPVFEKTGIDRLAMRL